MSTLKESAKAMKAKNAEQWSSQKAMENERDKATDSHFVDLGLHLACFKSSMRLF